MDNPLNLRADAQRNYNLLIKAAGTIFSVQGSSATLDTIAKQAGVGIGTLYRHFPTRKSLLEALYADKLTSLTDKASDLLASTPPDQALAAWLKTTLDYTAKYGGFRDLMSLIMDDEDSSVIAAGSRLLSEAQKSGSLRADVTIDDLLQLVSGITSNASDEELERSNVLLSVIVAGLKPEHPTA